MCSEPQLHFSPFHIHTTTFSPTPKFSPSPWLPASYRSKTLKPTPTTWTTPNFVISIILGQKVQKVGLLNTVGFLYKMPHFSSNNYHLEQ
jgi:hypothetical protein